MTDLSSNQVTTLKAAVTPDHHSQSNYVGQVIQIEQVTVISDDGTSFEVEIPFLVSWASISKILELIKIRAQI